MSSSIPQCYRGHESIDQYINTHHNFLCLFVSFNYMCGSCQNKQQISLAWVYLHPENKEPRKHLKCHYHHHHRPPYPSHKYYHHHNYCRHYPEWQPERFGYRIKSNLIERNRTIGFDCVRYSNVIELTKSPPNVIERLTRFDCVRYK